MAQEVIIRPAPEVETIAQQLIEEYHPELTDAVILYLFTSAGAKCSPEKCNPKVRYLASIHVKGLMKAEVASGPDFLFLVNELEWEILVTGQHRPFVDHRLEHCGREMTTDGTPRWVLKAHGVEEHPEVLQRFGAWSDAVKQVRSILQPELELGFPGENTAPSRGGERVTISSANQSVTMTGEEFDALGARMR